MQKICQIHQIKKKNILEQKFEKIRFIESQRGKDTKKFQVPR